MAALHDLTALEQAAAIRSGDTTSVELTEHYLARSQQHSDTVGAFVVRTPELALEQARAADALVRDAKRRTGLPPLLGVVCPVKDLDSVAGVPTRYGSALFEVMPEADDNVVSRMRTGGLVFTGKTNTPEFGLPCYTEPDVAPPARTPWDLERSAGGSSGGAAAAVASGLAPLAHGSDGGGSIRIPSSVTGLVGIKPSRGRISSGPVGDAVGDITTHGPIARTVADAAALLDVMAGRFTGDPHTALPPRQGSFLDAAQREPGRLRIGFYTKPMLATGDIHPEVKSAVERTVLTLESLGHELVEVEPPFDEELLPTFTVLWCALALLAPIPAEDEARLRPLTQYLRARGREYSAHDLASAVSKVRSSSRAALIRSEPFDAVLAPTLADLPAFVGQLRDDADPAGDFHAQAAFSPFCATYNITGQPSINIPANWTQRCLPVGVQLIGRSNEEETIISLAAQVETASDWTTRRPAIWT